MGVTKRFARSFIAIGEDGAQKRILVYVDIIDAGHQQDAHAKIVGPLVELFTEAGEPVNCREKGVYQVVETGEVLHSDDPSAP